MRVVLLEFIVPFIEKVVAEYNVAAKPVKLIKLTKAQKQQRLVEKAEAQAALVAVAAAGE